MILQHLEGAAWNYIRSVRYNSWEEYGKGQAATLPKGSSGPWFSLRDHAAFHTDTLTDRIAP